MLLYQLSRPLAYLWIKEKSKNKIIIDWCLPIVLSSLVVFLYYILPLKTAIVGKDGLLTSMQGFLQIMPGFYLAALAAISTFNKVDLDYKLPTPSPSITIKEKGVDIARVTLHVGLGTFRPVKEENVLDHHMHSEFYRIDEEAAEKINNARKNNGRIIAVGTTSTRTLESVAKEDGTIEACSGWTQIFIYPGYKFKAIDCLITNFHLPESTLVMLVSALAGRENVLNAYETAVKEKYRFFSFGDAMFIK